MGNPAKRIESHNRACVESMWTPEEALAWAESLWPRWPARRWRVEGARGGSSRVLTSKAAEAIQHRVGGCIVRLIPERKDRPRDSAALCELQTHGEGDDFLRFCGPRCPGRKKPKKPRKPRARKAAPAAAAEASL